MIRFNKKLYSLLFDLYRVSSFLGDEIVKVFVCSSLIWKEGII